ncbi:MAG: methylcobamide--CoM methyltransferase, partial [Nitrospinae bacterium]|nr:methylcobamide--CoM methyltransferase [Nitrospinota bacterium]
ARAKFETGEMPEAEFRKVQEEVTCEVVAEQLTAGLDLVTDGHICWDDPPTYFAGRLGGVTLAGLLRYFDTNTYYRQPVVSGPLQWQGPISVADYQFAVSHSTKPVKAVVPGPYTLAQLSKDDYYHDFRSFVLACAEELHKEAKALAQAGAPLIQFDEPSILFQKADFPLFREAMQRVVRDVAAKTALYMYFGDVDGLYPDILELPVDIIGLDFVMGKKNFEIIREAPFTKELGFGIVDARNTRRETPAQIAEQVRTISRIIPPDRLYVHPNCGLEFLPREVAYEKLAAMVAGVQKARTEL